MTIRKINSPRVHGGFLVKAEDFIDGKPLSKQDEGMLIVDMLHL